MCVFAASLLDVGQASALCSTEAVDRLAWRQSRESAEDASGACCSGGVGMEVGKEQQAQARRDHTGELVFTVEEDRTRRTFLALLESAEVVKIIRCGVKRLHGVWQAHETQPITVI